MNRFFRIPYCLLVLSLVLADELAYAQTQLLFCHGVGWIEAVRQGQLVRVSKESLLKGTVEIVRAVSLTPPPPMLKAKLTQDQEIFEREYFYHPAMGESSGLLHKKYLFKSLLHVGSKLLEIHNFPKGVLLRFEI